MSKVCDLIDSENGLSVKLRCENYFDVADYENIKTALRKCSCLEEKRQRSC